MKNDSCLTVSRRAAIIRQDAEENYGTLLTLGRIYAPCIPSRRTDRPDETGQRRFLPATNRRNLPFHYRDTDRYMNTISAAPTTKTPPTGFSHTMTCIVENGLRVEWQGLYSALL